MKITTTNGVEIDTESIIYQDFLRDIQDEEKHGKFPEPSGYRTLGEVIEQERRRRERETVKSHVVAPNEVFSKH